MVEIFEYVTGPVLKLVPPPVGKQTCSENYRKVFFFRWRLKHFGSTCYRIINSANLRFFTLRAKLGFTKIFLIRRQVVDFLIIAISLKFCLLPCVNLKITWCRFFATRLAKHVELVLKKIFIDVHSYLTQPYPASSDCLHLSPQSR